MGGMGGMGGKGGMGGQKTEQTFSSKVRSPCRAGRPLVVTMVPRPGLMFIWLTPLFCITRQGPWM
jgi:hypothetical protein